MSGVLRASGAAWLAFLLVVAAGPAAAYTISSPAFLAKDTLDGARIVLTIPSGEAWSFNYDRTGNYTLQNVPSGVSLSIGSISLSGSDVTLTLRYSGDFTSDWNLSIRVGFDAFLVSDGATFGPIPVYQGNAGLRVGSVSGRATEGRGQATFPVELRSQPSAAVTVTAASQDTTEGMVDPSSLIFSTTSWNTAQTVTVTGVDDNLDDGNVIWQVRLDPSSSDTDYAGLANVDVDVTTFDNEPVEALSVNRWVRTGAFWSEMNVTTASLRDERTRQSVTIRYGSGGSNWNWHGEGFEACEWSAVTPGTPGATGRCLTLKQQNTGSTAPSEFLTMNVTPSQNMIDNGGVVIRMTSNVGDVMAQWVPLLGPRPTLVLSPASIPENGGVSTVTATLDRSSSAAITITVSSSPVSPTVVGDFTRTGTTLTIAAGDTTSTGTVTVAATDNTTDAPDKSVTVSGTEASSRSRVPDPMNVALTITDDEAAPGVTLFLDPSSVSENGGTSTVTAALSHPSSEPSTVTVTAAAGFYTVGSDATITIAAGDTTATSDTVVVTAVDDDVHQGSAGRSGTVTATLTNGQGAGAVTVAALTLTDDETLPTAALVLSPTSITETGGVSTVTATLSGPSNEAVTVTVAATAGTGAGAADFDLSSATTLTIAAGATVSAGTVTVTANGNNVDSPDKSVTVSGTAAGGNSVADPLDVTLTLEDDDTAPTATLFLNPSSVSENGGTSTVTATLSHPSSEPSTVTVTAAAGFYTVGSDATITIAAGDTTAATDTATVTAVNDTVHQGSAGRSGTVTATLANGQGAGAVTVAALTLTDDETLPTAALVLSPTSISETGGVSTVTATLSGASSEAVTVTVAAAAGTGAGAADFDLSSATTLIIAAGDTTSAGTVTVTANGNDVDSPNKSVTVSGTAAGGNGVVNPLDVTLTLEDDDATATATLVLTPPAILENGGVGTVTATLSHPSSEATTLTVAAAPGTGAAQGDFTLSTATTLTIAAGATTSVGTVTVTAVDNAVASGRKQVRVSATAAGGRGVVDPSSATLILRDDELGLAESAVSGQATEEGGQATFTVVLRAPPTAAVTVAVSSQDPGEGTVDPSSLIFSTTSWNTAQTVTVTGADDDVDDGDVIWQVRLDPASGDTDYDGLGNVDVDVTTTDDDTAGVEVSPATSPANRLVTTEDEGEATFTVTLASEPLGDVVLDVASDDTGEGTVDTDAQMNGAQDTLTFTAGDWDSAQTVTVAGVDDTAADGDQDYTVTLAVDPAATADATYDGLGTVSVLVVNRDNDATADVNGDGSIGPLDGLLMYYAYTFEAVFRLETALGQRVRGFLSTLRGTGSPAADDAGYKAMLQAAWDWRSANPGAGDVNGDGSIGPNDGLLMYYAYTFETVFRLETALGQRVRGFLGTLRSPTSSYPATDAGYKAMLDAAWRLRGPSS